EGLNLWIAVPLLAFILVAANMHVSVREQRRHLTQKAVKEFVRLVTGGVECRLKDTYAALDLVWTRCAAQLGMSNQPTCCVTGDVKLRHHANAAIGCIGNDLAHLILSVVNPVRSL